MYHSMNAWCLITVVGVAFAAAAPVTAQQSPALLECTVDASGDDDRDGLSDDCEYALARTFAPILAVRSGGCNWDAAASRPGGGYLYIVQPVSKERDLVRLGFMPAYFHDCGWRGAKCWLPTVDCSSHVGDSEIIVVEVQPESPTHWRATGLFLSAHCFGRSGGSCRWYRARELEAFDWLDSAPVVWVSEGRNANYPSWQSCDSGHYSLDTCDHHDVMVRFPIGRARNLGSAAVPAFPEGCISGAEIGNQAVGPAAIECFFDADMPFRGWQGNGRGATSYARYLSEIVDPRSESHE